MKGTYGIILTFVVLGLLGFLAIQKVAIRLDHQRVGRSIQLSFSWPNSTPQALEKQVTSPMEGVIATLRGVEKVESSSGYQHGNIKVTVDENADLDQIRFEVAALVRQTYKSFPLGVSYPVIALNVPNGASNSQPFLIIQLNGEASPNQLVKYIENQIKPYLAGVEGIHSVDIYGGESDELLFTYNANLVSSLGISKADIIRALTENGLLANLGSVRSNDGYIQTISLRQMYDEEDFKLISVKNRSGRIIKLGDITTIEKMDKIPSSFFRINGRTAIQIVLATREGVNQLVVGERIKDVIAKIESELPGNLGLRIEYDATDYIYENVVRISKQGVMTIMILFVLVSIILRNWRSTIVLIIGFISSLLLSALIFYFFKIEIHIYSLAAVTVAIGIIMSNMFVMFHHYRSRRQRQVITAQIGSALVTGVSLSITWLLPENVRIDLSDFATTLLVVQFVSLAVSFWLVPAMMERMDLVNCAEEQAISSRKFEVIYSKVLQKGVQYRKVSITLAILLFGIPFFSLPSKLEGDESFAHSYNSVFANQWFLENLKPVIDKTTGGTLRLFVNYVYNKSFYQNDGATILYIEAAMPNHSTVEQMDAAMTRFESDLGRYSEIDRFITSIKNGQHGNITIYFKKTAEDGFFPYQLKARAVSLSTEMSGIDWNIYGVGQGFSQNSGLNSTPTFNVLLKGYNYDVLEEIALKLKNKLTAHSRIQDVDINRIPGVFSQKELYAYRLKPEPVYWAGLGIGVGNLFELIQVNDARPSPSHFQLIGDEYRAISIKPAMKHAVDIQAIQKRPIIANDSSLVRIGNHAGIEKEKIVPNIIKEDQQYLRQISFEYMGTYTFGDKFLDGTLSEFEKDLPLGYTLEKKSQNWWQLDEKKQYGLIVLVLAGIFVIGSVMFESLRQPFSMMFSILLTFVGLFLAFYWSGVGFDQGGYASFLLVSGIVTAPVMLVINEYNLVVKKGNPINVESYTLAVRNKFYPGIFSLIAAFLSLIPYLIIGIDQPFWYSLAVGSSGGICAAFFVWIIFVPVFLLPKNPQKSKSS